MFDYQWTKRISNKQLTKPCQNIHQNITPWPTKLRNKTLCTNNSKTTPSGTNATVVRQEKPLSGVTYKKTFIHLTTEKPSSRETTESCRKRIRKRIIRKSRNNSPVNLTPRPQNQTKVESSPTARSINLSFPRISPGSLLVEDQRLSYEGVHRALSCDTREERHPGKNRRRHTSLKIY